MLLKNSLLALNLSAMEIVVMACIIVLCLTLLIVSIVMLAKTQKQNKATEQSVQQNDTPIVIHLTKIAASAQCECVSAPAEEAVEETATVDEAPVEEAAEPVAEEVVEEAAPAVVPVNEDDSMKIMRYNRSFRARIIQSDDQVKEWYGMLKNAILSYEKVNSRISWKYESFTYRRNPVAKLFVTGKTLYLYLPLNAADYAETKYKLEDASNIVQVAETPARYKLKSERRVKYALELIGEICEKLGSEKQEREPVDYYEPYCGDLTLINKGLIKRVIEDAKTSFIGANMLSKEQNNDTESDENN